MSLKGKTAIITGGSRGIGKACAIYLAKQGADIVFNYSNNSSMAEETADEIKNLGVKVLAV